ncbi:hypothetical protein Ddye_006303 [Dipteronia dyeriana]|uniref:DUF4371 domain-containing protein n=1 Tax=Dipteronia dyeriana TaxID=168575 RepID=A0AAE0CQE6_9ROSI|nr:hypothetical protein Ddye_006303 [Dipteronia dyeriana]
MIREESGDAKFRILVDESNKEQIVIILRFVDLDGFVRDQVFQVLGVDDTNATTLQKTIYAILPRYNLLVENLRGMLFLKSVVSFCVRHDIDMPNMCARYMEELCRRLVETRRSEHFFLIDRLIHLVLTLLVYTATT